MNRKINESKFSEFMSHYQIALAAAMVAHPQDYMHHDAALGAAKMGAALRRGSHNHDGRGFKGACKAVGIRHTRKAIDSFVCDAD